MVGRDPFDCCEKLSLFGQYFYRCVAKMSRFLDTGDNRADFVCEGLVFEQLVVELPSGNVPTVFFWRG